MVYGEKVGCVEVCYLEEKPESYEGPFLKEERDLLEAVTERLGRIVERKNAEEALQRIEWMLTGKSTAERVSLQPYGDLTVLNTSRLILEAVGGDAIFNIVSDYLDLLGTSSAVYEKNGDYAFGILSSGWCRLMDWASRQRCGTPDNREALDSGKWHCHESCWADGSRLAIETGNPVDIGCRGGIHIYALPIRAGREIVGSINFGYGDPPRDIEKLQNLAETYGVNVEELIDRAQNYESRPPFIIDLAKKRLHSSAYIIGGIVERKKAEEAIKELEQKAEERTAELRVINESLQREITERKLIEEELKTASREWRITFDSTTDLIMLLDGEMKIIKANLATTKFLRRPFNEILGKNCFQLFYETDIPPAICPLEEMGKTRKHGENELYLSEKGIWILASVDPIFDNKGNLIGSVHIIRDITERKKAEEALCKVHEELEIRVKERTAELTILNEKLRNLYSHLQTVREEERTHIAREIHDEFGAILTVLNIDLTWIEKQLPENQSLIERIKKDIDLINSAIKTVQRISTELRPGILDHLGLAAAVEWYVKEFANRAGVNWDISIDMKNIGVDRDISTAVFRILQETLTNSARYAEATKVSVRLSERDGLLVLEVSDNGKGISEEQLSDAHSFGLIGMRERVKYWGGDVTIKGIPNKGTTVTVRIPMGNKEALNDKDIYR